ncbi:MAG TPA: dihydroneopterin aldolase [Acidimicrobiales bacterium]|nr:dihydroneopterin aldolase [Acidimicrobiales bacterium]
MNGRIEIRDLRAFGVHGVLAHERAAAQPFAVDVDATLDVSAAARSDALADTVDYGALASAVAAVVTETSFSLLEALAAAIARRVLDDAARITSVDVVVRKLRPPVSVDVGSIGVRVVDVRRP